MLVYQRVFHLFSAHKVSSSSRNRRSSDFPNNRKNRGKVCWFQGVVICWHFLGPNMFKLRKKAIEGYLTNRDGKKKGPVGLQFWICLLFIDVMFDLIFRVKLQVAKDEDSLKQLENIPVSLSNPARVAA